MARWLDVTRGEKKRDIKIKMFLDKLGLLLWYFYRYNFEQILQFRSLQHLRMKL